MTKTLFTFSFFLAVLTTYAQQDTLTATSLDEVVVTANKYPQKQSTTGKVITVISKEVIEQSQGKSLAQLLNEQAGITINGALNNAGSVQTLYMRGAASGRALILLDGIPVSDPSMINNEFDLNLFSLDNIDRIEICKGAQSTLYGSDAVAGVVNIITLNPDIKKLLNVKSTLSGGNYGTFKGSIQATGKVDKFTYSARYAKLHTNGFSAAYDSTGKAGFDKDNYNGDVLNGQLIYQLSPALSFRGFGMYSRYKTAIDASTFTDEKDYTAKNKSLNTGAGFSYKTAAVSVTGTYQYSEVNRNYKNDSGYLATGDAVTKFEQNDYYGKSQFAELYAAVHLGGGFTLLQGSDFRYSSYNQQYNSINAVYGPYSSSFPDTSLSQTAMYGSLNYSGSGKKLNIELGGRLNTHSRYGTNYTYTFNPSYALTNELRIFGSIASGFKAPTLYQLSINDKLMAEKSVNYEAGVQLTNAIFSGRAVYFNRKIDNGIDYNYTSFQYFNFVKQVANGLELEATVHPVKQVNVTANYTFISARETTQNRVTNQDTVTYSYSLRRPKHSLNINTGWSPLEKLYFSASAKYVSDRYDVGGYGTADVLLKNYLIVGAHASYAIDEHFKLFADGQNLTDKKFFDVRGYNSIPAMVSGGVTLSW